MAIVFGLENPTCFAKSDFCIPECTEGGGGSTGLGNIPKKYHIFSAFLIYNGPVDTSKRRKSSPHDLY